MREPLPITGPWTLNFPSGWGAPDSVQLDKLISWTEHQHKDIKYFSGTATYRKSFNWTGGKASDERYVLDLGNLKRMARNGETCRQRSRPAGLRNVHAQLRRMVIQRRPVEQAGKRYEDRHHRRDQSDRSSGVQQHPAQTQIEFRVLPRYRSAGIPHTFGFPFEMTLELAAEQGLEVDKEGFEEANRKHQELSRTVSAGTFKAGLQDHSEVVTRMHTATHLLHAALHQVLGPDANQKGSNITPERLRFDFTWPEKMTDEQIKQVEDLVNEKIKAAIPVEKTMTTGKRS